LVIGHVPRGTSKEILLIEITKRLPHIFQNINHCERQTSRKRKSAEHKIVPRGTYLYPKNNERHFERKVGKDKLTEN